MFRLRPTLTFVAGLLAFLALDAGPATATVVYQGPNEAKRTVRQALSVMKGGDTLIIRGGTCPERFTSPPSGSPGQYTIVRSEHVGGVIFYPASLNTGSTKTICSANYTQIEGIKLKGSYVALRVTPSRIASDPRRFKRSF